MGKHKTAYQLARSQVSTPAPVVKLYWKITHSYRASFGSVLDLGAGDCRFSVGGTFKCYKGIEIDTTRKPGDGIASNVSIAYGCAFRHKDSGYDACIGNPPYVRHHDLDEKWRNAVADRLDEETDCRVNRKCNLFVYFMFLSLLKSKANGLVSLIVPYEWVSRPSSEPLRHYIASNRWHVDVYRFTEPIFDDVLTTASISVIDKKNRDGHWRYHDIDLAGTVTPQPYMSGADDILPYCQRGRIWAMRGMSPGTQKVFTLTDGERIHAGLTRQDVLPCVTTLRHVPPGLVRLTKASFKKHFIDAGVKCWLIKSFASTMSDRLKAYLDNVPLAAHDTSTCNSRPVWHLYDLTPPGNLLLSTGFVKFGPKILINSIGAHNLGSICGVYSPGRVSSTALREYLTRIDFEGRIVPHSNGLKKVEIRQLNGVLGHFSREDYGHV